MIDQVAIENREGSWWKKAVFYQIYPRSFVDSNADGIGDLQGIISRLDYLNDGTTDSLGVDAIWFSPFFTSPDHDFGYDIADYCDIDPRYGSLADFDQLLSEAHKRGIKVILDLVVNHTSNLHPWFLESRSSIDNPKRDWYIWKDGRGSRNKPPNNWRNNFFGSAWSRDDLTGQYYLHSFLKEQPDLNWANPEVKEAIADVIRFWLERGVDGFRLDVAHIYCKDEKFRDNPPFFARKKMKNGSRFTDRTFQANIMKLLSLPEFQVRKYNQHQPETHKVLKEFRQVFNAYPDKTSVGEILAEDPAQIAAYYGKDNDELHMNFYFELLNCRFKAGAFRRCIDRWEKTLPSSAWPAYTFSNHDVMRAISRYNHDGRGDQKARLLILMLLTLRGTPFIYYGEEIGMKEVKIPRKLLKDPVGIKWYPFHPGRDGCRSPMQWTGNKFAGFSDAEPWLPVGSGYESVNVQRQKGQDNSILSLTKRVIWTRKNLPALQEGSYSSFTEDIPTDCFVYFREKEDQKLAVCLNFSGRKQKINLPGRCERKLIISTNSDRKQDPAGHLLILQPFEGCLINCQGEV